MKPRMVFSGIFTMSAVIASVIAVVSGCQAQEPVYWTDEERTTLVNFWSAEDRFKIEPLKTYEVRLTVPGSKWIWDYNTKRGKGKVAPTLSSAPTSNEREKAWERWINSKVAWDRYVSAVACHSLNKSTAPLPKAVIAPGHPPRDLVDLAGIPPVFAQVVLPNQYRVKFEDSEIVYRDYPVMQPRYPYYRFDAGVMSGGTKISALQPQELESVLELADMSEAQLKAFKAISLLEGGFDSVNTYDTGFVSVGFLQFASLKDGAGSLGRTLLDYKRANLDGFNNDFHQYGIEVSDKGELVAFDLESQQEKIGASANEAIIQDKRLIAVFQRAGRYTPYRAAQMRVAKVSYWPMAEKVTVKLPDVTLTGTIGELFQSEAGIAVMVDRKVNTGNVGPVADVCREIAIAKGIQKFEDLQKYEALLIKCLWFRFDPAKRSDVMQPDECEMIPSVLSKFGRIQTSSQLAASSKTAS